MPSTYPYDPSGQLPSNYIQNESKNVLGLTGSNAYLLVPEAGPFYKEGLTIIDQATGQSLILGTHYYLSHYWAQASQVSGKEVYGSITILGSNTNGVKLLNYQTIGGSYIVNRANAIVDGILASAGAYLNIDWSTAPTSFPATPHTVDLAGSDGVIPIYQAMVQLAAALRSPSHGVHFDDLVGADSQYATGVVTPFMSLVSGFHSFLNTVGSTILDSALEQKLDSDTNYDYGLNHHTFDVGRFKIKIGKRYFTPGVIPTRIAFVGDPFPHAALYTNMWVGLKEPVVVQDKVFWARPDRDGVGVSITLDENNDIDTRLLIYIAVGF